MYIGIHVFFKVCLEFEMMCPQNCKTIDQYKNILNNGFGEIVG